MSTAKSLVALAEELGEAVNGHPENVEAVLPRLEAILAASDDVDVVIEAVGALDLASDPRAAEIVLRMVPIDHPEAEVRLAVARALPGGVVRRAACWERVVEALAVLSSDDEDDVRDWACFGLGQVDASSLAARDALALRLADPHDDTRCEALRALAMTGDERALPAIQERLGGDSDDVYQLEIEAAAELADPRLHPLLLRLGEEWREDEDELTPVLAFALARCRPEAGAEAEVLERALVARVEELLAEEPVGVELTASLSGHYPLTVLSFLGPDGAQDADFEHGVWQRGREPATYRLEEEARSAVLMLRTSCRL